MYDVFVDDLQEIKGGAVGVLPGGTQVLFREAMCGARDPNDVVRPVICANVGTIEKLGSGVVESCVERPLGFSQPCRVHRGLRGHQKGVPENDLSVGRADVEGDYQILAR